MKAKRRSNRAAPLRDRILDYLRDHPGATSIDIADAFNMDPATIAGTLTVAYEMGLVWRVRKGRRYEYRIAGDMPTAEQAPSEVDALKAKLAELEARLSEAEAKHPDLRQIDYEAYRPALVAYYAASDSVAASSPLDGADRDSIHGLIAAMPFMPKGE